MERNLVSAVLTIECTTDLEEIVIFGHVGNVEWLKSFMYGRVLVVEKHKQRSEFESDNDFKFLGSCSRLFFDLMMTCYTMSDWRLINIYFRSFQCYEAVVH
jgi:hypothetical protein